MITLKNKIKTMIDLKNKPWLCGLLGVLIGSGGTLGTQALFDGGHGGKVVETTDNNRDNNHGGKAAWFDRDNFRAVPYDSDGDVFITEKGSKYHREYCSSLRNKETRQVDSEDAAEAGLKPCKRCRP